MPLGEGLFAPGPVLLAPSQEHALREVVLAAELRGTLVAGRDLAAALQLELAAVAPSRHRSLLLPVAVNLTASSERS